MHCPRCGAQLTPNTAFCSACGAPVSIAVGGPAVVLTRPGIITLLGILQLVGAAIGLLCALAILAGALAGSSQAAPVLIVAAVVLGAFGGLQLMCGLGLLKLKSYGRTIQLVFAWIGLIGIPVGTIISILILIYLYKPGIKALFSGRQASEFTAVELAEIAAVSKSSTAMIVLVVAVVAVVALAVVGTIAAIAVPGLLRARMAGNEASAIGSLRAINSGEASYASGCAAGGYAVTLEDLAKPPKGSGLGFVAADLASNGVIKSGYRVSLAKDGTLGTAAIGSAAGTCNASTDTPASSFFASAEPLTPGSTGTRYFATDTRGTIFQSASPIANPIVPSRTVVPVQ